MVQFSELPSIRWLDVGDQQGLVNLVKEATTSFDPNDLGNISRDVTFELLLPVSIPEIHVVHEVELLLPANKHFTVGKTITAQLIIKSNRNWEQPNSSMNGELEFSYDIIAPHDKWAISGKRRSFFKLQGEGSKITCQPIIDCCMIPLLPGKLPLPRIEVSAINVPSLKAEVDLKNGAQTVLVIPELDRASVSF
ncbi:hypothetical protein AWJ20_3604 [Sugiyamaella lignohabitans]|uniref:TRAPPC10/Trs130 C-terminal domain-containing protein n=1 Tax=Sugiyamaella lignohabitans TaxID=796027 RepID=A0A170QXT2_9ASCO|nr:uncharacterized protein AWJ20_3604 [Sugiyamaella lignohabitans]ANB15955.1 hypothetical protein AWJ20_3604 [Sugiyamaella lignohabitans]